MAAPTNTHVLLETMALGTNEGAALAGAGGKQAAGDSDEYQQQELVALVEDESDADGDDQRLAEKPGTHLCPRVVAEGAGLCVTTSCAPCIRTARCGPARRVVWGGPVRSRPLPD